MGDVKEAGTVLALQELDEDVRSLRNAVYYAAAVGLGWLLFMVYVFFRVDRANLVTKLIAG